MNFYFTKTTNIPVYGHIAVYIQYFAVCLKIDATLRCLENIIFTIKTPQALDVLAPLGLLIMKTLTHVLNYYKYK